MHPLIPAYILKNYSSGRTAGSFSAIGIFVDVSGFSAMTDGLMEHGQHGAEILAEVMRAVFKPLMHSVYEQGGFVITQAGDAFNAVIPMSSENDDAVRRALTAAWNIRSKAGANLLFSTPYGSYSITVKVGLAFGETAWGIITSLDERRAAYYFQGTAVDDSAEAEHHAEPGEVIVNSAFYELAKEMAIFEPVDQYHRLVDITCKPALPLEYTIPAFDLDLASRFYPRELYLQKQSGEFRRCTCLFVRLPTIRTETQLGILMQTIFELQDQYGGLLELRFGDKGAHLLLIWGAPISFENDIERSLNFIFELQTRTTIPLNAGITYRRAHAGFVGTDMAEEYTAFGRGVNLAARFMTTAPRGEIWVDENIAQIAENQFMLEYGGEQLFKGFSHPQKYYILLERKERIETVYGGQLVGRHEEMHTLQEFISPILSGQFAGIMIVRGEPGVGKSRLIHEVVTDLANHHPGSFQVFLAQTDEIIRQPFNPLRYWLYHYFDINDTQSEARSKRSFNRKMDDLIEATVNNRLKEELDRTRSFLGALVGLFWPDSLYEQLEAQERYENTIIALNALIQAESLRKPCILVMEDIQWFDEDSRRYLSALLRSMTVETGAQVSCAVIASARLEDSPISIAGFDHTELLLKQLDRTALGALAAEQLEATPSESLLDLLSERSAGNPFFAEEMLRYLKQNQLLDCQPDGCIVNSDQAETLPINISALLVARLDLLLQEVKELVQTAAVIGREFDVQLLAQMAANPADMKQKINQVEQAAIWMPLNEIRLIFRHAMMRDAAYGMLIMARRKQLHKLAVDAIESVYGDHLNTHYGELAHHSYHAEQYDKAFTYYRLAGEAAHQAYQNDLAVEYFSRALSLTSSAADRFELVLQRIQLYDRMGMMKERKGDLAELERLAKQLNDPSKEIAFLLDKANFELDTDAYEDAIQTASMAISLAEAHDDFAQAVRGYRYSGTGYFRMGKYQPATEHLQIALERAERVNDPQLRSNVLNNLSLIYLDQEKIDLAVNALSEALQIAKQTNQLSSQAGFLNNLAQAIGLRGDFINAQTYFQQSLEIIRKIGARRDEGLVLGNLGWIAASLGDYKRAHAYHTENLKLNRQMSHPLLEGYAMINLSAAACALGNFAEAVQWGEQAVVLTRQINNTNGEAWALTYLGHARLAQDHLLEAAEAYDAAIKLRNQLQQNILAAEPLAGLARVLFVQGNISAAGRQLKPILSLLDSGSMFEGTDEPVRIYHTCYIVLDALNDERANSILAKGYETLQARAAQIPDETIRRQFLEDIPHHRQLRDAWENKNRPI